MAYHHFAAPADITRMLYFFLKPGGSLLIADILLNEEEEFLPDFASDDLKRTVVRGHGFSEAEIRSMFEGAGLMQFEFALTFTAKTQGKDKQLFLARGVKPDVV